jgi:hypothetical protein
MRWNILKDGVELSCKVGWCYLKLCLLIHHIQRQSRDPALSLLSALFSPLINQTIENTVRRFFRLCWRRTLSKLCGILRLQKINCSIFFYARGHLSDEEMFCNVAFNVLVVLTVGDYFRATTRLFYKYIIWVWKQNKHFWDACCLVYFIFFRKATCSFHAASEEPWSHEAMKPRSRVGLNESV